MADYLFRVTLPDDTHGADDILASVHDAIGDDLAEWDDLTDFDHAGPTEGSPARDAAALDRLSAILTTHGEPWPSGADFIDWCAEIVRTTGRTAA